MSFVPSRSLPTRFPVVLLAGLLAGGLWSASVRADTPPDSPGRVSGLILDRSNRPVAGATITTTAGATSTDDQGRWSLSIPQGDHDLAITAQEDEHTVSAKVRRYTVGADTKLNVILAGDPGEARVMAAEGTGDTTGSPDQDPSATFTRAAMATTQSSGGTPTFSGQVLDADGDPVTGGVEIRVFTTQTYNSWDAMISEDGSFSLEAPPGSYTLGVTTGIIEDDCYGCAYERVEQRVHDYTVENFRLDGDRHETIRLPRPSTLSVAIVDPGNRPVARAWVRNQTDNGTQPTIGTELFPGAPTKVSSSVDGLTGADGMVNLEFIPGAGPATIRVDPPPGTQLSTQAPFPSNATSLTIQVPDGPTLHGRMLRADGGRLGVSFAYLSDEPGNHWYRFGDTKDGYAVTAPAGRYRMNFRVAHDEEGESSDYLVWSLQSELFELVDDRALDLTVPLGDARLWVVDDQGEEYDDIDYDGLGTGSEVVIAEGIRGTAHTTAEGYGDNNKGFPVIGPSSADGFYLDHYDGAPSSAYVAPGEDTIIAFIAGTGPGYDDIPPTTTTTISQPTTTTTTQPPASTTTTTGPAATPEPGASTANTERAKRGYWALASDGTVYDFGDAPQLGNTTAGAVDLEPTPTGTGYWTLNRNGTLSPFGDAVPLGNVEVSKLAKGEEPASLSATPSGKGYWVFTNKGRVVPFGDASFLGDMSQMKLNGPVLGSVATPSGKGYYMVASDGGIFAFGDAAFAGSMGGTKLNAPVQSLVPDSDGKGYWLVASDGGIFAFDAPFRGSMGATELNKPVVGMVRYGDGYLMVGADGGIFNFSSLPFSGSLGDKPPASPVVAVAALP